jgi:hypothetical protein
MRRVAKADSLRSYFGLISSSPMQASRSVNRGDSPSEAGAGSGTGGGGGGGSGGGAGAGGSVVVEMTSRVKPPPPLLPLSPMSPLTVTSRRVSRVQRLNHGRVTAGTAAGQGARQGHGVSGIALPQAPAVSKAVRKASLGSASPVSDSEPVSPTIVPSLPGAAALAGVVPEFELRGDNPLYKPRREHAGEHSSGGDGSTATTLVAVNPLTLAPAADSNV